MSVIRIPEPCSQNVWYEVDVTLSPLGEGGMGKVYRGIRIDGNKGDKRDVAVKFLYSDLPDDVIQRARTEASVQIQNENLLEMMGFIQIDETADGKVYHRYHVVSEYLHGVMLHDVINGVVTDKQGNTIEYAEEIHNLYVNDRNAFIVLIIKNVLSGLLALHDNGYVHRDIDPSNIMITSDRKIKIIDFGIVKKIGKGAANLAYKTVAGKMIGKPAYASPELAYGDVDSQNATTDLYAVGIMLYQFVTGNLPFVGSIQDVLEMQKLSDLPLENIQDGFLKNIIADATSKKQAERYQSASEFRVAIEKFEKYCAAGNAVEAQGNIMSADPVSQDDGSEDDNGGTGKKKLIFSLVAAVLVLAVITGGIFINRSMKEKEEKARIDNINSRLVQLEYEMIDSADPAASQEDAVLAGYSYPYRIKSVGAFTRQAESQIAYGKDSAASGVRLLERIVGKGYRSSAYAAYLLGRLHYEYDLSDSLMSIMRTNSSPYLKRDNSRSHELNIKAVQLDPACYQGIYELACDYYAGEYRTNIPDSENLEKARELFEQGYRLALSSKDDVFIGRYENRLAAMGVDVEGILSKSGTGL